MHRAPPTKGPKAAAGKTAAWAALSLLGAALLLASLQPVVRAQSVDAESYFAGLEQPSGYPLRNALHQRIRGHTRIPYRGSQIDSRAVLREADSDLDEPLRLRGIYSHRAVSAADTRSWVREHVWPRSMGIRDDSRCNMPFADLHALFVSIEGHNAARKNYRFEDCAIEEDCKAFSVDEHDDRNYMNASAKTWEVWDGRKGDVARALLYMDVRYEGGPPPPGCAWGEPQLVLTDEVERIESTNGNADLAYMGTLSTLIRWHDQDPPDERDRQRDDAIYRFQGNRNPFITHPEWVARIWSEESSAPAPIYLPLAARDTAGAQEPTAQAASAPTPTITPAPYGRLIIQDVFYDGLVRHTESDEYAWIVNAGIEPMDLAGWRIHAGDPGQDVVLGSHELQPGEGCRVYTNQTLPPPTCGTSFESTSAIWNNDGDCGYLFDPAGDEADAFCYEP